MKDSLAAPLRQSVKNRKALHTTVELTKYALVHDLLASD
jgi:hypothetical protein